MSHDKRKLVFAPFGADDYGEDVLLFEHGILFALETAVGVAGGFSYADVHAQTGGPDKRERPVAPFSEADVRVLAARAGCEALIDGMLSCVRDDQTGALTQISVALRAFFPQGNRFAAPPALTFRAFFDDDRPETLSLDFDLFVALQYRVCEALLDTLGVNIPPYFTTDALQATSSWEAYYAFLKGLRVARTPETKLGYYNQAVGHDPSFLPALLNSAVLMKNSTDYHGARGRYSQAVSLTTDPAQLGEIYFELGLCSISLGDPKTARNFWERALAQGVDNPTLYVNMAGTYEQEENIGAAIDIGEQAVARFPDAHKAVVNLARLHAMRGNLDRAITLYKRALVLEPEDALRHSVLGGCLLAAERPSDARVHFEQAVALDPHSEPGLYAQQELQKLGPAPSSEGENGAGPRPKRWGLF
jgi:tetratricopeptide (TPR) repeat protein